MSNLTYPFTEEEAAAAFKAWGCNCGPTALAFALQIGLDEVRSLLPEFDQRRYVNVTMMKHAIAASGAAGWEDVRIPRERPSPADLEKLFALAPAVVRVQWTGPWSEPGMNQRWACNYTHWIATWRSGALHSVFDVNGGMREFWDWEKTIVPLITDSISRADGGWFPTHIWRIIR